MNKMELFRVMAIASLTLFSCSQENTTPPFEDIPVVEGYLHAGKSPEIKISRQVAYSNDTVSISDSLDSLFVKMFDGSQFYDLYPIGEGVYTNPMITVDPLDSFEVELYFNNKKIFAKTTIPQKPTNFLSSTSNVFVSDDILTLNNPDEIQFSWDNSDGSYYYILIENIDSNPAPVFDNDNALSINQLFKMSPTLSDSYSMKTRRFSSYGHHRIVLFHINPDMAALYLDSDNTSQNISNPSSEIANAYGIFSGINSDTIYVNVLPQ